MSAADGPVGDDSVELTKTMARQRGGRKEPSWGWLAERDYEFMAAHNRITQSAAGYYEEGDNDPNVLSQLTKEMLLTAVLAGRMDWERFAPHLEKLMDLGATNREILEIFQTTGAAAGAPVVHRAVAMLLEARTRRGEEA